MASKDPGSDELVEWLEAKNLHLLNTPGTGTFFRPSIDRESVLDLTFATSALASQIQDWQTLPDLGSDHKGILFTIPRSRDPTPRYTRSREKLATSTTRFITDKADWTLFASSLEVNIASYIELNS